MAKNNDMLINNCLYANSKMEKNERNQKKKSKTNQDGKAQHIVTVSMLVC